jgi:uroporphyrinogen-III synthase
MAWIKNLILRILAALASIFESPNEIESEKRMSGENPNPNPKANEAITANEGFAGLRVLTLESRRAPEMAKLIANCGGKPVVAPSMREVPLESNTAALEFARRLQQGQLDMVIFLTGVGTRALTRVVETKYPKEEFVALLSRIHIIARGPKPAAVLREMQVPISVLVPEPNTWRELLQALDQYEIKSAGSFKMRGCRVAVQEYGVSNPELIEALKDRGALVGGVPVYQWMLPEDTGPLRAAVTALVGGEIDVAMFTSSAQIQHLLQIATAAGVRDQLLAAFERVLVASIGPITSQELGEHGIAADIEPSHPRMGILVNETAHQSHALLQAKCNRKSA